MTGTLVVLVSVLIGPLLRPLAALVATSRLARHSGQRLKSMSWSPLRGYTAEFFDEKDHQSGNN